MDGWIDGWMYGWIEGLTYGRMEGWMAGRMDGRMDGSTDYFLDRPGLFNRAKCAWRGMAQSAASLEASILEAALSPFLAIAICSTFI